MFSDYVFSWLKNPQSPIGDLITSIELSKHRLSGPMLSISQFVDLSKNFRDLESLGKSNRKKRSQIWQVFLINGVKLPRKKVSFWQILPYWAGFFWYQCHSLRLKVFLPPFPKIQHPNFLDFQNPWGKVMKRNGLRFENCCS